MRPESNDPTLRPADSAGLLRRMLRALAGREPPRSPPPLRDNPSQPRNRAPVEEPYQAEMVGRASQPGNAPRDWERVLAQFESMPEELADLKRSLGDVLRRFDDALDLLGSEARRLSTEASTLALVADRLQTRLGDMDRAIGQERTRAREAAAQAQEPQFQPGEPGVTIILAAVPGFQGLMDGLRGLDGLGVTESASVLSFRNDEASIRVVLRRPASARQIVEGLQSAIRRQVLIEEARPEAQRLRLRFVEEESRR